MKIVTYDTFWKRSVVRNYARLFSPPLLRPEDYILPKTSILHYVPDTPASLGIDKHHTLMRNVPERVLTYTVPDMITRHGTVRNVAMDQKSLERKYLKQNRQHVVVKDLASALANDRLHMICNYAIMRNRYKYLPAVLVQYQEYQNMRETVWREVGRLDSEKYQFIPVQLPVFIPGRLLFNKYVRSFNKEGFNNFHSTAGFDLLDIWRICTDAAEMADSGEITTVTLQSEQSYATLQGDIEGLVRYMEIATDMDQEETRHLLERRVPQQGATLQADKEIVRHPALFLSPACKMKTHFVFMESGNLVTIRLGDLINWAIEYKNFDKILYKVFDSLLSLRSAAVAEEYVAFTPAGGAELNVSKGDADGMVNSDKEVEGDKPVFDTAEDDDDDEALLSSLEEKVEEEEVHVTAQAPIADKGKTLIEAMVKERGEVGRLSSSEQRYFNKHASTWRTLVDPITNKPLEALQVTSADLTVDPLPIRGESPVLMENGMTQARLETMDKKYAETVMHKDMVAMMLAPLSAGIVVKNFNVKENKTAVSETLTYTVQVQPVGGEVTTLPVTIPKIRPNGEFLSGGTLYRLSRQKGEPPIVKTKPSEVALTSAAGKLFIMRNENAVANWGRWIKSKVMAQLAPDVQGKVDAVDQWQKEYYDVTLPRHFTAVGEFARRVVLTDGTVFNYDLEDTTLHTAENKKLAGGSVICGIRNGAILTMDYDGTVHEVSKVGRVIIGTTATLMVEADAVGPMEYTEIGVFNRRVPVVIALSYLFGLNTVLKKLPCNVAVVPASARVPVDPDVTTIKLKFKDFNYVITTKDQATVLLLAGFNSVRKVLTRYNAADLNNRTPYLTMLSGHAVTAHHLRELVLMNDMFIDPITYEELIRRKEPTTFEGLLLKSNAMLTDDFMPKTRPFVIRSNDRIPMMAYNRMVGAVRAHRSKGSYGKGEITLHPNIVMLDVLQDQSKMLVERLNPIHNLKEHESVTFTGHGGRSTISLVKKTRGFGDNDLGVICEQTTDSSMAGVRTYTSANPKIIDMRGNTGAFDPETDSPFNVLSSSGLIAPFITHDDSKRAMMSGIQNSHVVMCKGYKQAPCRTGYESIIAHRTDDFFTTKAEQSGKVIAVADDNVTVEYKDGTRQKYELGIKHGLSSGTWSSHEIISGLQVGHRFKQGDILTFDAGFFTRDSIDPTVVSLKFSTLVNCAFIESIDNDEDGIVISSELSDTLTTTRTFARELVLDGKSTVHNLIAVGSELTPDSILCTIQEYIGEGLDAADDEALASLQEIAAANPRADHTGKVTNIEVLYYDDLENLSDSLRKICKGADAQRAYRNKTFDPNLPTTGRIDEIIRVGGTKVTKGMVAIRILIDSELGITTGDKFIVGNQLKCTTSVISSPMKTASGKPVHIKFAYDGVLRRQVEGVAMEGYVNLIMTEASKKMADMFLT